MTIEGIPIWFWITVAIGIVSLMAMIAYAARRKTKTQYPE